MRHLRTLLTALVAASFVFAGACDKSDSNGGAEKSDTSEKTSSDSKKKTKEASGDSELPFEATGPVAVVNGEKITKKDFNDVVRKKFANSRRPVPKPMAEKMKTEALKSMIDKRLIETKLKESDVEATDKELEEEFKKFRENFPTDQKYQDFLDRMGTTEKEMKGNIGKDVRLKKILREKKDIEVTDEDAKKHYENNMDKFKEPEKVKARHILIKTDKKSEKKAKKKAKKLLKKAQKDGADFAKLAKENSEGPSAKKGGDLGYFSKERMVDAFAKKAFSMKNGEIAGPVQTDHGFHIIKREGHKKAKTESFESAKSDIVERLERKKFSKSMKSYLKKLRKDAEVEKMPDNIKVNASGGGGGLGGLGGLKGGGKLKLKKGAGGGGGAPKLKLKKLKGIKKGSKGK